MVNWRAYKNVQRLYKEDDDDFIFAYYNLSYTSQTVNLVDMLFEEIREDFPKVSADDVYIKILSDFPHELVLRFYLPKYEVEHLDLLQFEEMPYDLFLEVKRPAGFTS